MTNAFDQPAIGTSSRQRVGKPGLKAWLGSAVGMGIVVGGFITAPHIFAPSAAQPPAPMPPSVAVSAPLVRNIDTRAQFLGQFSAVQNVELRAQVGGTLTKIGFKDGDIVQKGDLLFEIDPTPYEIKLSEGTALLESAQARVDLAKRQFYRADTLSRSGAGSVQIADQASEELRSAQAAVDQANAEIRDARFDLDHTRITAPFTGRIGTHLVSVGNLVAGSRAATSPTTLLATLVSVNPVYLNFDMSEADYLAFQRDRQKHKGSLADKVTLALSDEQTFGHTGTLDFVDNTLDRSSGTIHARATVENSDLILTPGGFARVRVELSAPVPTLLVPDAAVLADQSDHVVMTVGPNNVVTPKMVQIGELRGGLRVIQSGLSASDKVIIDGIPRIVPGAKVSPTTGSIHFGSDDTQG